MGLLSAGPGLNQRLGHHVIAGRSSEKPPVEQPAPPLAEEGRFGEWLSHHAQQHTLLLHGLFYVKVNRGASCACR